MGRNEKFQMLNKQKNNLNGNRKSRWRKGKKMHTKMEAERGVHGIQEKGVKTM